jgi:hypothetical protein
MSKLSKFIKVDKNVLVEYIYNDGNLVSEPYNVLVNTKDNKNSYVGGETSATGNTLDNQLFKLDAVNNRFGKVDTDYYSFLQLKNYPTAPPIRHDEIKIHLPVNWTFGEYLGFYIRVWTYDSNNQRTYELSNFYFDMTDVSQQYLMNFTSPALLFQEKLWGKNIKIEVPSLSEVSDQLTNNRPTENSINANLTNGSGLSTSSPVFIDFHFIRNIETLNNITTYLLGPEITSTIPQTPEFEKLGLVIEDSENGDFFEIYGTYNNTIAGFKKFIDDSVYDGKRYYVQYNITMYEQNIRGKTTTITITDDFNETIEYRPIIKYSTTTAIIDVEMRLIDAVDESYIIRKASYGMLQNEVSKYSLRLKKINLANASKPKVYNQKSYSFTTDDLNNLNAPGLGNTNNQSSIRQNTGTSNLRIESVKVPFPVLVDRFNVIAKSENVEFESEIFYGLGKIQILIYPFDNIIRFNLARGTNERPEYFDLTGFTELKLTFKNDDDNISFPLFLDGGDINLSIGQIAFQTKESSFKTLKRIYNSGINVFYITGKNQFTTSVIYSGLFKIYDNADNVTDLRNTLESNPEIITDSSTQNQTAIVTRRQVSDDQRRPVKKPDTESLTQRATQRTSTPRNNS